MSFNAWVWISTLQKWSFISGLVFAKYKSGNVILIFFSPPWKCMIVGCYYTFMKYFDIKDTAGSQTVEFTTNLGYWYNLQYTWLALGKLSYQILISYCFQLMFIIEPYQTQKRKGLSHFSHFILFTGIVCAVVLLIVLLLLIFLRKRILIAIALIKESSRYSFFHNFYIGSSLFEPH